MPTRIRSGAVVRRTRPVRFNRHVSVTTPSRVTFSDPRQTLVRRLDPLRDAAVPITLTRPPARTHRADPEASAARAEPRSARHPFVSHRPVETAALVGQTAARPIIPTQGGVSERSNEAVLKTAARQQCQGPGFESRSRRSRPGLAPSVAATTHQPNRQPSSPAPPASSDMGAVTADNANQTHHALRRLSNPGPAVSSWRIRADTVAPCRSTGDHTKRGAGYCSRSPQSRSS